MSDKTLIVITQEAVKMMLQTALEERTRGEGDPAATLEVRRLANGWWHITAYWGPETP